MGDNEINDNKKCKSNAGDFDCRADVAVQYGAHRPMVHIPGFTRSHWMPPLGECSHHIAASTAMIDDFG